MDILIPICFIIALLSFMCFSLGFFMLFSKENRKNGLKLLLISTITFIIGFGTCVANFKI